MNISALGMGILRIPTVKDPETGMETMNRRAGARIIDACMASGINFFDTAYTYGDSEVFTGEVLSRYRREQYYLSSKYKEDIGRPIEEVFFEELERCRTDYFDIFMLHGLNENTIGEYMKPHYVEFLEKQKEEGKIRHIGFSSHARPETLRRFLDYYNKWDMVLIQLNRLDWDLLDAKEQYEALREKNIPIFVMEPLKGSNLAGLGAKEAFRWLQDLDGITCILSGMTGPKQVFENAGTFAERNPLSEEELAAYEEKIENHKKENLIQCTGCRYCRDCSEGLDIPLLLKGINEKRLTGDPWRLSELENVKGYDACIGCGECVSHCPQNIDIPAIFKEQK